MKVIAHVLVLVLCGGCGSSSSSTAALVLAPEVHIGPARELAPGRVLVTPPSCGSIERPCSEEHVGLVREIVGSGLEVLGYSVVPSTELLLTTRQRSETHDDETREKTTQFRGDHWSFVFHSSTEETTHTVEHTRRRHIELLGSTFEDLPPVEQRAVMTAAGADAVVTTRLILGAKEDAWRKSQDVEIVVRLGVSAADSMGWAVRCRAPVEELATTNRAIEHAARCAIAAARVANRPH